MTGGPGCDSFDYPWEGNTKAMLEFREYTTEGTVDDYIEELETEIRVLKRNVAELLAVIDRRDTERIRRMQLERTNP